MPFSPQSYPHPSQTPTRPSKRPFSTSPASSWPIPKKFCKKPDIKRRMSLPPLPAVPSDAALTIFVHSSLKSSEQNERFGDVDRLAFVGHQVLSMAIAESFFEKRPMLTAVDLEIGLADALSSDSYDQWVSQYRMRDKVACPANLRDELKEPRETQHLFDAYVGALYVERGYSAVKSWIQPLVDPDFNPASPSSASFGGNMAHPPPPASPPPPLPGNSPSTGVFLASFNQTAAQRGVKVEWNASQSGPGHALTWRVECIVGGVPKGTGAGRNKQQAKEEAARQALEALGWAAGASGPYHCAFSRLFRWGGGGADKEQSHIRKLYRLFG